MASCSIGASPPDNLAADNITAGSDECEDVELLDLRQCLRNAGEEVKNPGETSLLIDLIHIQRAPSSRVLYEYNDVAFSWGVVVEISMGGKTASQTWIGA